MQALAGDSSSPEPSALEAVFAAHHGRVFRAAHRITGNVADAEDVLQTVFLRLARREGEARELANATRPASWRARSTVPIDTPRASAICRTPG